MVKDTDKPKPSQALMDFRGVVDEDAYEGEPTAQKYLRTMREKNPAKFEDNRIKLERAYSMELAAWQKRMAVKEGKAETAGALEPSLRADEGTRKAVELCTKILIEIRAKAEKEFS